MSESKYPACDAVRAAVDAVYQCERERNRMNAVLPGLYEDLELARKTRDSYERALTRALIHMRQLQLFLYAIPPEQYAALRAAYNEHRADDDRFYPTSANVEVITIIARVLEGKVDPVD